MRKMFLGGASLTAAIFISIKRTVEKSSGSEQQRSKKEHHNNNISTFKVFIVISGN